MIFLLFNYCTSSFDVKNKLPRNAAPLLSISSTASPGHTINGKKLFDERSDQ